MPDYNYSIFKLSMFEVMYRKKHLKLEERKILTFGMMHVITETIAFFDIYSPYL